MSNNDLDKNTTASNTASKGFGWKKMLLIGLVSVGVLGGAATATLAAKYGSYEKRVEHMRGKMLDRVDERLTLDDQQKQAFENLTLIFSEKAADFRAKNKALPDTLKTFVTGEYFDRNAAQLLVDDRLAELRSAAPQIIEAIAIFYDSLDTTQQAKVREFIEEGKFRHGHRHRGHHGDRYHD